MRLEPQVFPISKMSVFWNLEKVKAKSLHSIQNVSYKDVEWSLEVKWNPSKRLQFIFNYSQNRREWNKGRRIIDNSRSLIALPKCWERKYEIEDGGGEEAQKHFCYTTGKRWSCIDSDMLKGNEAKLKEAIWTELYKST